MATSFVIIGGGPAGNTAATHAARLGAKVSVIERDMVGGAAHLWDCIPSKTMIATGGAVSFAHRMAGMGLERFDPHLDLAAQRDRIGRIEGHLHESIVDLLTSQGVRLIAGTGEAQGAARRPGGDRGRDRGAVSRRRARSARAAVPASPTGRSPTASASSPPGRPIRPPSCPST